MSIAVSTGALESALLTACSFKSQTFFNSLKVYLRRLIMMTLQRAIAHQEANLLVVPTATYSKSRKNAEKTIEKFVRYLPDFFSIIRLNTITG